VPPELRRLGASLEAQNASGEMLTFVVKRIENGKLTVDANHPLAGQTVKFRVTVRDVRDATR
jgi:FKBP-type peptidyl-prolyl cis-trans isomerase SlyD